MAQPRGRPDVAVIIPTVGRPTLSTSVMQVLDDDGVTEVAVVADRDGEHVRAALRAHRDDARLTIVDGPGQRRELGSPARGRDDHGTGAGVPGRRRPADGRSGLRPRPPPRGARPDRRRLHACERRLPADVGRRTASTATTTSPPPRRSNAIRLGSSVTSGPATCHCRERAPNGPARVGGRRRPAPRGPGVRAPLCPGRADRHLRPLAAGRAPVRAFPAGLSHRGAGAGRRARAAPDPLSRAGRPRRRRRAGNRRHRLVARGDTATARRRHPGRGAYRIARGRHGGRGPSGGPGRRAAARPRAAGHPGRARPPHALTGRPPARSGVRVLHHADTPADSFVGVRRVS